MAASLAERGAPEGATVIAATQTSGRGRLGRAWFSPPGAGLYVSVVFRNPRVAPMLTLAGGVAVADGIRAATGLPVSLKWPNDVVVQNGGSRNRRRKLAGILAEGSTTADGLQYVVLGIGINLRSTAYPPELYDRASSIETELGRAPDAGAVLVEMLAGLAALIVALDSGNSATLIQRWRSLSPSAQGAPVTWTTPAGARSGVTAGIDDSGALLVRSGGTIERVISGEMEWG